jgi:hypothetical protein
MGREKNNKKLNSLLSPRHALAAVLDKTNYRQSVCLGGPLRGNHPTTSGQWSCLLRLRARTSDEPACESSNVRVVPRKNGTGLGGRHCASQAGKPSSAIGRQPAEQAAELCWHWSWSASAAEAARNCGGLQGLHCMGSHVAAYRAVMWQTGSPVCSGKAAGRT